MASWNTSPSPESSEIHDIPIRPPQPVARKEYKEEIPDISVVSDIADNGSQLQNFEGNYLGLQTRSKYFHIQSEFKDDLLSKSDSLLPTPNNFLHGSINHTSCQQQLGINTSVSNFARDITERTKVILDHNAVLPAMTYLNPDCQSCVINHAVLTNKGYNGQYVLPKNSASILPSAGDEQSDKEIRSNSEVGETNLNKTCHKHAEFKVTSSSNHKSIACNHVLLSCPLNSNEPETFKIVDVPDHSCSKDKNSKLRKSICKCNIPVSSDSRLSEFRKFDDTCGKERVNRCILKDMNIMCPACFKKPCICKPCTCNFSAEEFSAKSSAPSDAFSSIWEYLKQQDEKINSIHEKVSNFLSQHASCLTDQPAQGNESSNLTESDIPYILNILEVHSDKIRELQDQINLLKPSEPKSSPGNNNKIDDPVLNQAQTINCANIETCNEDIHCPYSHNVLCHEQRQKVTKTSTSTMTSFTIEKNDKLVYHKQMTVVSDMREKKESLCLPKEHDSPTTKNYSDEENVNSNSQKRKSHKLKNYPPILKCKHNVSSNSSSDSLDPNDNQVIKTSHKSEKKSKCASSKNKGKNKKNANDLPLEDNDVQEKKNSPALKTAALKSHLESSKQKLRKSTSPKIVDTAALRDLGNKKISSASSSTDTEYKSTKQRHRAFGKTGLDSEEIVPDSEESTIVSKYGLPSRDLSMGTKRYLDNYGLKRT